MTQDEYEHYKQKLDEQLRTGIELLKAAHAQQIRALELVWMMGRGEGPGLVTLPAAEPATPAPPVSATPPPQPPRRRPGDLITDVEDALPALPEIFDRNDVLRTLGYEPDRGSLYRALQELTQEGVLSVHAPGGGRIPTQYRKAGTSHNQAES